MVKHKYSIAKEGTRAQTINMFGVKIVFNVW